ncbi:hypothetical protein AB0F17_08485 [Nonomuraea sp. NPDC026600]|uniref:hypothetical protein n=1 Tax=Nonomuraea sp. NPDC026600 TaxID=3155363 RepID=UPI0033E481E5
MAGEKVVELKLRLAEEALGRERQRAGRAEATVARVSAVHHVHHCEEDGHVLDRTPNPCKSDGYCSCGQPGDRCPTLRALAEPEEEMTDGAG